MSLEVNVQCTFERIQALRAAGDTEGWAQLLIEGALTKEERQSLHLTGAEAMAYRKLKEAHQQPDGQPRIHREQRATYENLCRLRQEGETYWIVWRVRKAKPNDQAVIFGVGLMPGIPRFELNAEEAEAVRVREQNDVEPGWFRVRAGVYRSANWAWYIERQGPREWVANYDGELWGSWDTPYWCCEPRDEHYVPFESLSEAKEEIGELVEKNDDDDDDDDSDD